VKASRLVATQDVWREEAEAQKARGDRLEAAVEELTAEVHSLRAGIKRLTNVLRAIAPELAEGAIDDDS
jgi:cell division protein FtsB